MTGDEVRQVCEAMLPQAESERRCAPFAVIERQRKLPLGRLGRALVISAGPPGGADQADVLRSDLACAVPPGGRSAFSRWFDAPVERFMAALADRSQTSARTPPVDLAGPLGGVTAWSMVEATPVTVRDALRQAFAGTGGSAAIKGHTVLSVGGGAPGRYHCRPARAPDRRHLTLAASWRGYGLLADLADARLARLQAGDPSGVREVMRRKDKWQPKVDDLARGQVPAAVFPGAALEALLEDEPLVLEGRAMEADVPVGRGTARVDARWLGVQTAQGSGFCLTTLPPRMGPWQVADLYRVRGEVARSRRWEQAVKRLDALDAEPPCPLKTLLQAARIASTLAALLAHTHHVHTRPPPPGAPRTEAPRHPRRLAWPLAVSCQSSAQACERQGAEATPRWKKSAAVLRHRGNDPHGRRRPSVLEQLRGWKRQPVRRKQPNNRDVSHGHIKVAA
jgi:hypothetical protein